MALKANKNNKSKKPPLTQQKLPSNGITVGCMFAAIGGFAKAFQLGGAKVLWATDKDGFASQTFALNFPNVRYLNKPVEELSVHGDSLESVDILTAGFPCQAFSLAGEKLGFKDPRGLLFLHIIRIIQELKERKPKILLLENVKNLKAHDNGKTFKRIQSEIQKAGYWFSEENSKILNTAEHTNIPQNRERIFMVAMCRDCFSSNDFVFPKPIFEEKRRTVKSFLDLNRKADARYYFTKESQYYEMFCEAIDDGGREAVYQLRRNYVRKNKSDQCFTLMANMGDGGHNQPVIRDKWGVRKLTPRECARLQGYDDKWFKIPPNLSNTQIYKQIGNSVTVPLVTRIAKTVINKITNVNTGSKI